MDSNSNGNDDGMGDDNTDRDDKDIARDGSSESVEDHDSSSSHPQPSLEKNDNDEKGNSAATSLLETNKRLITFPACLGKNNDVGTTNSTIPSSLSRPETSSHAQTDEMNDSSNATASTMDENKKRRLKQSNPGNPAVGVELVSTKDDKDIIIKSNEIRTSNSTPNNKETNKRGLRYPPIVVNNNVATIQSPSPVGAVAVGSSSTTFGSNSDATSISKDSKSASHQTDHCGLSFLPNYRRQSHSSSQQQRQQQQQHEISTTQQQQHLQAKQEELLQANLDLSRPTSVSDHDMIHIFQNVDNDDKEEEDEDEDENGAALPIDEESTPSSQVPPDNNTATNTLPSPDDNGLAVAQPVSPTNLDDMPQAQEWDADQEALREKERKQTLRRRAGILLVCALVLVLAVVVPLALVFGKQDNNSDDKERFIDLNEEEAFPDSKPFDANQTRNEYIRQYLPNNTLDNLQDPISPQSMALVWLRQDPLLMTYPIWRLRQRFALATFHYATGGDKWYRHDNWLNYTTHECQWYSKASFGLELEETNRPIENPCVAENNRNEENGSNNETIMKGQYQRLWQSTNGLVGAIPLEIYELLPHLNSISLHSNFLHGTLSSLIGQLSNLQSLSIATTQLSGSLPTTLGLLIDLSYLIAVRSGFDGTLPTELGLLQNLTYMLLDSNNLQGPLPSEIGRLSQLKRLYLQRNSMEGDIPVAWRGLLSLEDLQLQQNFLTGTLSRELIASWTNLIQLQLDENYLSGSLPIVGNELTKLEHFGASQNLFNGTIPSTMGLVTSLQQLDLSRNRLIGIVPSETGMLSNLLILYLHQNKFYAESDETILISGLRGSLPSELGKLHALKSLAMHENLLSSSLPSEVFALSNMTFLSIHDNALSSYIPSDIGRLTQLSYLAAGNNDLFGPLPSEIGLLTNLLELDLSGNGLSSLIPEGMPPNLEYLRLDSNRLIGSIPITLRQAISLKEINLANNQFSGQPIPSYFGLFRNMTRIDLGSNLLTGRAEFKRLPRMLEELNLENNILSELSIGNVLSSLTTLQLSGNQLGSDMSSELRLLTSITELYLDDNGFKDIPEWLTELTHLKTLSISSNQINATLPTELANLNSSLEILRLSNNFLHGWLPNEFRGMEKLRVLDLSLNMLTLGIPRGYGDLTNLEILNLQSNYLSGGIPNSMQRLSRIKGFFLGENHFYGELVFPGLDTPDYYFGGGKGDKSDKEMGQSDSDKSNKFAPASDTTAPSLLPFPPAPMIPTVSPAPTIHPSAAPSLVPSASPSEYPTESPSASPSQAPSASPSEVPSEAPSMEPSINVVELPIFEKAINEVPRVLNEVDGTDASGLKGLFYSVYGNSLSGVLPTEIGKLTDLVALVLDDNEWLTGTLPSEIGKLSKLETFSAFETNLEGTIASEFGELAKSGSLKTFHWNLSHLLDEYEVGGLTGTIPGPLCSIESLMLPCFNHNESLVPRRNKTLCGCHCNCSTAG